MKHIKNPKFCEPKSSVKPIQCPKIQRKYVPIKGKPFTNISYLRGTKPNHSFTLYSIGRRVARLTTNSQESSLKNTSKNECMHSTNGGKFL